MSRITGERDRTRFDRGTIAGLCALLLWSATVAFARSLTEQLGSLRAAASVYLVAGALGVVYTIVSRSTASGFRSVSRRYLIVCGALFVLYTVALFQAVGLAVDRQQVLEISLVNYLWCPLTLLLSIPVLKKTARPSIVPATILVLVGLYLVLMPDTSVSWSSMVTNVTGNPLAYALALAAALSWALYSNLTHRLAGATDVSGVLLFLPATGAILLGLALANPEEGAWNLRAALETLFLGASTATAYLLWDFAMRKTDVVFLAACSYLVPLLATLVSCLYLAVLPGVSLWIGCLLLVVGSLASWRSVSR